MSAQTDARDETHITYVIDKRGCICNAGKFEGEMEYVPFFWDASGDGSAETLDWSDGAATYIVEVDADDRAAWSSIGADIVAMHLQESEQGFVSCEALTQAELDRLQEENEADSQLSNDDYDNYDGDSDDSDAESDD